VPVGADPANKSMSAARAMVQASKAAASNQLLKRVEQLMVNSWEWLSA
jgi:hypothetical protein